MPEKDKPILIWNEEDKKFQESIYKYDTVPDKVGPRGGIKTYKKELFFFTNEGCGGYQRNFDQKTITHWAEIEPPKESE